VIVLETRFLTTLPRDIMQATVTVYKSIVSSAQGSANNCELTFVIRVIQKMGKYLHFPDCVIRVNNPT
jgi:hypothetical protein